MVKLQTFDQQRGRLTLTLGLPADFAKSLPVNGH